MYGYNAKDVDMTSTSTDTPRIPLSKERVLRAAIDVADKGGIESLTMRKLAQELGVEAMSLYYHVANKDQVLDGVVDVIVGEINAVVGQIDVPAGPADWKVAMRMRILAAREVLLRHPWAPEVIETRTSHEPCDIELLRRLCSVSSVMAASHTTWPITPCTPLAVGPSDSPRNCSIRTTPTQAAEASAAMFEQMASQLPNLVGMMSEISHDDPDSTLGWCDDQTEFEFGLDLILDGLDRRREA